MRFEDLGEKPYAATVTYRAFTPIIAESNAARKDYWLIGLNLTQTPDRSFYAIMRYPHNKALQPGTTRDDFEFRLLDCGIYPKPVDAEEARETDVTEEVLEQDMPADLIAYKENDTLCLFDRIEDVEEHANQLLQQNDALKREAMANPEAGPVNRWSRLKVEAR